MNRLSAVGIMVMLLVLPLSTLAASENAYQFEQALNEVIGAIKDLDINFFAKISLRLKINNALTYASQLYPNDLFDPEELTEVMKESVEYGNPISKTVSAVYAVDMAHKMGLSEKHFKAVRYTMITGTGDLKVEGVPQEFLDTVASYGQFELPACCL